MNSMRDQMAHVWVVTIEGEIYIEEGKNYFRCFTSEKAGLWWRKIVRSQNGNVGELSKIVLLGNKVPQ